MSEHTPGPWRAKKCTDRFNDDTRCDGIAPDYHNHNGGECWDQKENCPYTQEIVTTDSGFYGPTWADAVLIAAAPELLAALKAIRDGGFAPELEDFVPSEKGSRAYHEACEVWRLALAAIAKAEGGV